MKPLALGLMFAMFVVSAITVNAQVCATIEGPTVVSMHYATNVLVALIPSNTTDDLVVELRCLQGTGKAVFLPGEDTVTNIRRSTTLTMKGKVLSNVESNMTIEVRMGESVIATNTFTVVDLNMISFARARQIAEQYIAGRVTPEPHSPVTVKLSEGGTQYQVTFENNYEEDVLKGEFAARVDIDSSSGRVLRVERGP